MKKINKTLGLDLVNNEPDYSKTWDQNWEEYRERYKKIHGKYPPDPGKGKNRDSSRKNE